MVAYSERERGSSSSGSGAGKLLGNSSSSYNVVNDTGVNEHNGVESRGKRKKKKNLDASPTVEEVGTGNGDELQGKTEKKKNKKKESISPVTVEDVDGAGNGCGDESHGKKRKKENLDTSLTVEEGKKEKKRKKRESTPLVPVEDVDEAGNGCADELQRKKRKKKIHTISEDCGPGTESAKKTVLITQELQTSNGGESIRKTKKKVSFRLPGSTQDNPPENEVLAKETDLNHRFSQNEWLSDTLRTDLIWGKYTREEDEILRQAVFDYIKEQGWEQEYGIQTVMNSKTSEARCCWNTIRKCLPKRALKRLHARTHRLFVRGNYLGRWSPEEVQSLVELHSVHGNDWKKISTIIGRDANNVKDKWRYIKTGIPKKGPWTPEEQQKLRALVLKCLHVRRQMAKKGLLHKHHKVVRDEISWEFIAEQMEGRNRLRCMFHWYRNMASSMVTTGEWSNGDDQLLLERLMEEFPLSEDLVEWDTLLENRSGEVCKRRWDQMQRCCGHRSVVRHLHFLEKLESLVKAFAPHLLDAEYDQQFAADLQQADANESEDDADT